MEDEFCFDARIRMGRAGKISFGKGKIDLLKLVGEKRSILKAAREMGMSYRHAWGKIKDMESEIGASLVKSSRGGRGGGSTSLTPLADEIIEKYDERTNAVELLLRYGRKPVLTVDGIVLRDNRFLAVKRGGEPFKGVFALPGGFVDYGETVEKAVVREVLEETSLDTRVTRIIGVYSGPDRDPRGHSVTCAFLLEELGGTEKAGDDAAAVEWLEAGDPGPLAFDHNEILSDALKLVQARGSTKKKHG